MKRALVFLSLSLAYCTVATADSVLNVSATNLGAITDGEEKSVALTFEWDPATNVLSNFNLQTTGPLVFSQTPSNVVFEGIGIGDISFLDAAGDAIQFDYNGNTSFNLQPILGNDQPSVFDIACAANPACTDNGQIGLILFHGRTVITQAPEPPSAELLFFGLSALVVSAFARH